MPAKSLRQQRYLYMRFGSAWVHRHHFDNKNAPNTPPKSKRKKRPPRRMK